ncbi:MAG: endo-1,4-beta-xylanase [Haliscomenobacter sp.]|uniref:endo-1,4-beta-xylanase n=1 Tax=Haliscomenobacter sp. TaxID=2717303 RepID=UPI0029A82686|nr:endo-1,4-beta-xylanase [Haliscomenobacter sp.]MDX2072103.1 endo-1,4-beta-xylanase [Haliscomenobacter sp.]
MKKLILLLFAGLHLVQLPAQSAYYTNLQSQLSSKYNLSGGLWLLPADENQALSTLGGYGGTLSNSINTTGQSFTRLRQMTISSPGTEPWSSGVSCSNTQAITKGSICLMVVWVRSAGAEKAKVNLFLERASTFEKEIFLTTEVSTQWQQFIAPFNADFDYAAKQLNFGFHTGYKAQSIQIAGIALIDFKNKYTLDRFPLELHQNYAGSEASAAWRSEADQRIEQIRKANFTLNVKKTNGDPVTGATVKMEMLEHEFKFGSAITANRIAGNKQQDNTYQQKIFDFDGKGHGFNEVVFENDMKWDAWEEKWFASNADVAKATSWLNDRGVVVRGHNLVWPAWQYLPDDMEKNKTNPAYLKQRINSHLAEILNYPGIKGVIKEWDVLNEITLNEELAKAFAGSPGYVTGREIYVDILKKVKEIDPSIKMYLNDYTTIDQGNLPGNVTYERTKQYLKEIQNAGIKIDGIGFQGHISSGLVSMYDVKTTLDDFYNTFGARAKITEYDYGSLVGDSLAARFTADFLTMCFSHPSVDGFLSWGFWQGAHWLNNGPYFRQDWSMRPAGKAVSDLMFNKWWTNTSTSTNASGVAQVRGFKGKYRITVSLNGKVGYVDTLNLTENTNLAVSLPTSVGVNDLSKDKFKLQFKNPVAQGEAVAISCSEAPLQIQLIGMDGRVLRQMNKTGAKFNLTIPNPPGLYLLRVKLSNGELWSEKLLVQ